MKYLTFLLLSIALCSCAYQQSTHTFVYHGTDAIPSNKQFYYVAYGVTGTSSALYNVRGGGHVRDGLVADAKLDLRTNSPLQANQAYANLSIDVIRTETGIVTDGTPSISQVQLTCVVSADIIQYCDELPESTEVDTEIITLDQLDAFNSKATESSRPVNNDVKVLDQIGVENEAIVNQNQENNEAIAEQQSTQELVVTKEKWDGVSIWYGGENKKEWDRNKPQTGIEAVVTGIKDDYYIIEYMNSKGFQKKKYVLMDSELLLYRAN